MNAASDTMADHGSRLDRGAIRTPQPHILANAPRCGARTRSGEPCRSPAIRGRARCRMHGGRGSGAPRGNRNAWKHGVHSARVREIARYLRATGPAAIARILMDAGLDSKKY